MSSVLGPEYELLQKEEGYEIRKYPAAKWTSTEIKNISHKEATSIGFQRLFKYIQGENEPKQKVDMTAPVTVKVVPGPGPNCESTFTESFYLPSEQQASPPAPSSSDVFTESRPEITVFVRTFGGFADDEMFATQVQELKAAIGDESKYHSDFFYTAGYDGPFTMTGRTNEVWFVKK